MIEQETSEEERTISGEISINHDHTYTFKESPRAFKRKYSEIVKRKDETIKKIRKKLYEKEERCERQEQKIQCLKELVTNLQAKNLISQKTANLMEERFSDVSHELFRRMFSGKNIEYSDTLKSFSLTLYFYSPCAYEYVRNALDLALPHPNTLRSWYNSVDGNPGFTSEAFSAISERTKYLNSNVYVCLTFDEMAIKKRLDWDGNQFIGYVNRGFGVQNNDLEEAKEALVLLVVGINTNWKIPIAYFLVNGMSSDEKLGVVQNALRLLHQVNVKCVGLTFDGLQCNLSLASKLGAKLDINIMQPYFLHPSTSEKVFILLDACHMIKLVRNLFSDLKVLMDVHGNVIKWEHIEELEKLQCEEGLVLANRLKRNHVIFQKQKMKVKLAVQVLSSSVSTSLRYLAEDLQLNTFKNAKGTADFCQMFDRLFDVCNCKSPFAVGYKSALRISNKSIWEPFLAEAEHYLLGLKDMNTGKEIYKTQRKTPIIGFLCIIRSIKGLFVDLVETGYLKYLLMYKFSQDHVEMFFCMIRGRFGWNNNPSALQFRSAYRQLLVRNEVKCKSTGNCSSESLTPLLSWTKGTCNEITFDPVIFSKSRVNDTDIAIDLNVDMTDHDYVPSPSSLTEYSENVVVYIAGYVVKKLKHVMCSECVPSLFGNCDNVLHSTFLRRKNNGGLTTPSPSVVKICVLCEKFFRQLQALNGGKPPKGDVKLIVQVMVLKRLQEVNVFMELNEHAIDNLFPENHVLLLVKAIVLTYMRIRLHHVASSFNFTLHKEFLRQHLNKSVLFLNQ